jgi:hypothetical protein
VSAVVQWDELPVSVRSALKGGNVTHGLSSEAAKALLAVTSGAVRVTGAPRGVTLPAASAAPPRRPNDDDAPAVEPDHDPGDPNCKCKSCREYDAELAANRARRKARRRSATTTTPTKEIQVQQAKTYDEIAAETDHDVRAAVATAWGLR